MNYFKKYTSRIFATYPLAHMPQKFTNYLSKIKAEDGLPLIFVLQNTMAAMVHGGPSLPLDFKFPFQNKSILIKLNLINEND